MINVHVKEIQKQSNGYLNLLVQQKKKTKRQHRKRKTDQHEPRLRRGHP